MSFESIIQLLFSNWTVASDISSSGRGLLPPQGCIVDWEVWEASSSSCWVWRSPWAMLIVFLPGTSFVWSCSRSVRYPEFRNISDCTQHSLFCPTFQSKYLVNVGHIPYHASDTERIKRQSWTVLDWDDIKCFSISCHVMMERCYELVNCLKLKTCGRRGTRLQSRVWRPWSGWPPRPSSWRKCSREVLAFQVHSSNWGSSPRSLWHSIFIVGLTFAGKLLFSKIKCLNKPLKLNVDILLKVMDLSILLPE